MSLLTVQQNMKFNFTMFKSINIFFLTCLCIFVSAVMADSCKIENPGKACNIHVHSGVLPAIKKQLLDAHNAIRQSSTFQSAHDGIKLSPFEWDSELEGAAQKWANECQETKDECRSNGKYKLVEQLVSKTQNDKPFNVTEIVNDWAKQRNNLIWAFTKEQEKLNRIGCGIKVSKVTRRHGPRGSAMKFDIITYYVVCNYAASE